MKILVIGNTGLNYSNNSTNNRMVKIFEVLNKKYQYGLDYYKLRNATLEVEYINYINKQENSNPIKAFKTILSNKTKHDICIAETFNAAIVAYLLYKFKKIPFIWRQFGTTFNDELETHFFKPKTLLKYILHRIIANSKGCKAIVCTEDGCANRILYLDKLKISPNKLYMVKNQRTEQKFESIKKENSDNKFRIVQVGRINPWKKIHILVSALVSIRIKFPEIMENIELNIIGISQDVEYENKLNSVIIKNNLQKNIFFKKDLEYDKIEKIFLETDLSVSLTAYNPIIESLQNGTPVITYEYGEIGEVFKNSEAVTIVAKNIKKSSMLSKEEENLIQKEVEDKIVELYQNRKKAEKIGKDGRKFVEDNFPTLDEHVEEIINIYRKVINAL